MLNPFLFISDTVKDSLRRIGEGAAIAALTALAYWGTNEASGALARRRDEKKQAESEQGSADRSAEEED